MKIKKSKLKELIRQSIAEIDFKSQGAFNAYNKKHKMRKSTKVNVAGKDTTAGEAGGKKKPSLGTSIAKNVQKNIDKVNKASKIKGPKPGGEFTIDKVMGATIGKDKVGDILDNPKHPNYDKAEKYASQFNPDDEKLVTGKGDSDYAPDGGHFNAKQASDDLDGPDGGGTGAKYSDYKKGIVKGPKPGGEFTIDKVMDAKIGDNKVSDLLKHDTHPDYDKALKYVMQFDPDDEKVISGKGGKDWDKHAQDAAAAANAKMDADEKKKKKKKESVKESKFRKRCTVKEIKTWMRTLEENRYKKTYASDARRVSWMVNNSLSEDYDTMPVSMKKKWPKAAYKRERFLAKEFVKHLMTKQITEQRLRSFIRKVIKEGKLIEGHHTIFHAAEKVMKDKQAQKYKSKKGMVMVDMQSANLLVKVWKKVNPKMKKILADLGHNNPAGLMKTLWAVVK